MRNRKAKFPWTMFALFALGAGAAVVMRPSVGGGIVDRIVTSAYTPAPAGGYGPQVAPRAMPVCSLGRRVNCVVDGDTLWLNGTKIRLVNIDAPEVHGRCGAESVRAADATRGLARLLHNQPIRIRAGGNDRYGRLLAAVATPAGDVGEILVRKRLAVRWRGHREPAQTWCGA